MHYFQNTTITDETGKVLVSVESKEIGADEVISALTRSIFAEEKAPTLVAAAQPAKVTRGKKEKAPRKVAAKAAPVDKKDRCSECSKPKRHAKWCSKREAPAIKETPDAAPAAVGGRRGIPPEKKVHIEELARAGKTVFDIIAVVEVSIPTVRRVCRDAGIELVSPRKAKAVVDESKEEQPPAPSRSNEPHPLDVRTLLTRGEYSDVKKRHFQKNQQLGEVLWYYKKNGMDELRRAVDSQNYDEYKQD